MKYRKFGKLDWEVSALGFGAMRLPQFGNEMSSPVNEELAIKMIRFAIDSGVNYVDTAYPYHMGNSERIVGKALLDGYREKTKLATKLSAHMFLDPKEINNDLFDRYLNAQLKRLQTDKIDFYLLHALNKDTWSLLKERNVIKWAEKKITEGLIGHLGFSFHDDHETFKQIVDGYDNWTFCQVQYNYLDVERQAGRKGVEYAAGKGLAVVIMEPLRGGQIAKEPPETVAKVWKESLGHYSRVEWALQWLWDQQEISVVLSGMSEMEQVEQNVTYAGRSGPDILSKKDMESFNRINEAYQTLAPIPCTDCKYCQPCPNGVLIPQIFDVYNQAKISGDPRDGWFHYAAGPFEMKPEERADNCVECGDCVKVCPQQIDIPKWLKKAHEELMPGPDMPMGPPPLPPSFED